MTTKRHTAPPAGKSGTLLSTPYAGGPVTQADTIQCCHCGYTSLWVAGSERWWDFCAPCGRAVCGRECCKRRGCVPQEQQLRNMETGAPADFRPVVAAVGGEVPLG